MAVVGVAAPAGGVVLFLAVSGGVYVDGDYYRLLHGPSNLTGDFVGASDAFFQGETVLKVKVPPVRIENSLSPLYRGYRLISSRRDFFRQSGGLWRLMA